ncbi:MAG: AraC family transcriptional regulator [Ruminococcaceae bacterium]|nr:AraC family transcriptional regulator [Oscillospiraceae bacterium]
MKLCDVNPFMRYAALQPSVMSSAPLSCSYDYRLFYMIEGNATLVLSDRSVPVSAGMLLYFRPGTPYYFDGKVKVIVLNFDMTRDQSNKKTPMTPSKSVAAFQKELVFENDPPSELKELVLIENAFEIEHKMQECLLHYCYPTPISDAFTSAMIKDMLCYIAQSASTKGPELPEIVQKITLYIQQNYDQDISNSRISDTFGYHSFYLNRVFKNSTGITIHQAVILERMRIAKRLLKETTLSINSVASESGFYSKSQFCTAFRKYTGYTPTAYRQKRALL